jgi:hypothetical protein
MGNTNEDFDVYELFYRNYKSWYYKINMDIDIQYISEITVNIINKTIDDLKNIVPKDKNEIKFSDVTYNKMPVLDKNKNMLMTYEYVPVFINNRNDGDPNECIKRFEKLNIHKAINRIALIYETIKRCIKI